MMPPITDDGWDRDDLTRRRAELTLPMVPLRTGRSPAPQRTLPDRAAWRYPPAAVGVGPDGGAVALVRSGEHDDLATVVRDDGTSTVLDGALQARHAQPLPGGRTLLVSSRARPGTANAQVWDADGRLEAEAFVGDGIAHVLTTAGGAVWLGCFDEAQSTGQRMIVRLDDRLRAQWGYPYVTERADLPPVDDVETLTTDGEGVVCHVWRTHHLLRVDGDEVTDLGPTGLFMVRAVLVQGDRGAFVGGQPVGGQPVGGRRGDDVVTPFRLVPDGVEVDAPTARLVAPDGRECLRRRLVVHGDVLHALPEEGRGGDVLRVTLDELLDGPRV